MTREKRKVGENCPNWKPFIAPWERNVCLCKHDRTIVRYWQLSLLGDAENALEREWEREREGEWEREGEEGRKEGEWEWDIIAKSAITLRRQIERKSLFLVPEKKLTKKRTSVIFRWGSKMQMGRDSNPWLFFNGWSWTAVAAQRYSSRLVIKKSWVRILPGAGLFFFFYLSFSDFPSL